LAVHFLDLACVLGGEIVEVLDQTVVNREHGHSTVSVVGRARMTACDDFRFDLDISGTARRVRLELDFERCACTLDFFPDLFRILPPNATPLDDIAAGVRRLTTALGQSLRPVSDEIPKRVLPHRLIYLEHLRRRRSAGAGGPFSLEGVAPTMHSLFQLCDFVYTGSADEA
jgi:hypothetical protein